MTLGNWYTCTNFIYNDLFYSKCGMQDVFSLRGEGALQEVIKKNH